MRPRIRTLKPEIWQDEKVGDLSMPARLLYIGLITMADDQGRLRELPSAILGHVFPYDSVTPAKLLRWLDEIASLRLIVRYAVSDKHYIAFPHWTRHQKVDKPNDSGLPSPPSGNGSSNRSGNDRRSISESIGDESRPPARTRAVVRSDPDPDPSSLTEDVEFQLPADFPSELEPHLDAVQRILVGLAERHRAKAVSRLSLASIVAARPRKPLVRAAHDFAAWADGKAQKRKDVVAGYRNWLNNTDDLASLEVLPGLSSVGGQVVPLQRPAALDRADAWRDAPEYRGAS